MKRKIAVCGNGWSNEYLEIAMSGIRKCAEENNADVFFFIYVLLPFGHKTFPCFDYNTIYIIIQHMTLFLKIFSFPNSHLPYSRNSP